LTTVCRHLRQTHLPPLLKSTIFSGMVVAGPSLDGRDARARSEW
jgi:hypothetical protein